MWIFRNGGNKISKEKPGEMVIKDQCKSSLKNKGNFNNRNNNDVDSDLKNSSSEDMEYSDYYTGSLSGKGAVGSYNGKCDLLDLLEDTDDDLQNRKKKIENL